MCVYYEPSIIMSAKCAPIKSVYKLRFREFNDYLTRSTTVTFALIVSQIVQEKHPSNLQLDRRFPVINQHFRFSLTVVLDGITNVIPTTARLSFITLFKFRNIGWFTATPNWNKWVEDLNKRFNYTVATQCVHVRSKTQNRFFIDAARENRQQVSDKVHKVNKPRAKRYNAYTLGTL